jgi:tRNA threonylcarbamoyladenosine biosynthesis protein TsaE
MTSRTFDVHSLADTEAFGRRLAALLFPGSVVALIGTLGAGKTNLVRAVAMGLDIPNPDVVTSPTFVLIQEYNARLPIYHFDAYRLQRAGDFADLGVHEYFSGNGVCLIEWADKFPGLLPDEHLDIRIEVAGEHSRRIRVEGKGPRYLPLVSAL